jgi:hypothetical protein
MEASRSVIRLFWPGVAAVAMLVAGCGGMGMGIGPNAARVSLTGAEQNPPVTTSASGTGSFSVSSDKTISGSVTTTGMTGTAAHIHTGAKGSNGPVTIPLTKTGDNVWSVPPNTKLTDAQYEDFKANRLYVNVHSAQHKPGEIRAQIQP